MKYRHVLCLNPYVKESSAAMGFFPPTGLEYIATALNNHVGKVTLIDLRQETHFHDVDRLNDFIRKNIDLVCVSVNWSYFYNDVCDLINGLPDGIPVVVGGQQATDHVEELFERCPNIDIIVRSEGEQAIQEIARGLPLEQIDGISYRKNGQIIHNPNRAMVPAETLGYPDRNHRRTSYHIKMKGVRLFYSKFDTVLSARGCPNNCKFCTLTLNPLGQKRPYSPRSPESVVDEIQKLDAEIVFFADDNFFADPNRAEKICDLLISRGIKKKYIAQSRLEIYKHPTMLRKAERAGFKMLLIGVESPHDRILKQLNKGFDSARIRRAFEVLRQFSFYYHCYFIYGNIGETEQEMLAIPQFAKEIGAHSISYMRLQARKFSPLKEIVEKTPGYHLTPKGFIYSDQYSTRDLDRIKKRIAKGFYTPHQFWLIVKTIHRLRMVSVTDMMYLLLKLPLFGLHLFERQIEKKNRKKRRILKGQTFRSMSTPEPLKS